MRIAGSGGTDAHGVNGSGQIVGSYTDASPWRDDVAGDAGFRGAGFGGGLPPGGIAQCRMEMALPGRVPLWDCRAQSDAGGILKRLKGTSPMC